VWTVLVLLVAQDQRPRLHLHTTTHAITIHRLQPSQMSNIVHTERYIPLMPTVAICIQL